MNPVPSNRWDRRCWQSLIAFLFPSRCAVCRSFWTPVPSAQPVDGTVREPRALLGAMLCPACRDDCQFIESPLCTRCGLMFASRSGDDHRCGECLATPGYFSIARAVGSYQGGMMVLVHQLKYQGRLGVVTPMARMLMAGFRQNWRARRVDMVIPVPMHPRRLRRRGFNQAHLLWRSWQAAAVGTEPAPLPRDGEGILARTRMTRPQTGLSRRERRRNIRGAFRVIDREAIQDRRLLLLDDVLTTGATVEEAARTLLAAGAARVDVLTFARTLK